MLKESRKFILCAIAGSLVSLMPKLALGAESIVFPHGPFEFSLAVSDLKTFAETGRVSDALQPFVKSIPPEKLSDIQTLLGTKLHLNATATAQLFYSKVGEGILHNTGTIVQDAQRRNGMKSLRAAMIQSARESETISPISILQNFPSDKIYINSSNLKYVLQLLGENKVHSQTLIAALTANSQSQVSTKDYSKQRPQTKGDRTPVQTISINLPENSSHRSVTGAIYLPEANTPIPLIIFSPGYGDNRAAFQSLRESLTSQGFAFAIMEHQGSDQKHFQQLLKGEKKEVMNANEWIARTQDISYVLDWLESSQVPQTLTSKLDLTQIGVVGYSLGGNTALNLAGAQSSLEQLQAHCGATDPNKPSLDLAPLMLCDNIPQTIPMLRDARVKAIASINAFGNHVFTPQGLQSISIPTLMITGSDDQVAPSLSESICPFNSMTQDQQSLVIIENGQHFFGNDTNAEGLFSFSPKLSQPDPQQLSYYLNQIVLRFLSQTFETNPSNDLDMAQSLQELSHPSYPLHLVQAGVSDQQRRLAQTVCSTSD